MLVSGAPTRCKYHANYIAEIALDFRDAAKDIHDPSKPAQTGLQLRLGLYPPFVKIQNYIQIKEFRLFLNNYLCYLNTVIYNDYKYIVVMCFVVVEF